MTKRLKSLKMWPLFVAVSAVIILAGIILYALLGFNTAAEKPCFKTFEVQYDVVAVINDKDEEIQKICEDVFEEKGLSYDSKTLYDVVSPIGSKRLVYEFKTSTDDSVLEAARSAVASKLVFTSEEGNDLDIQKTVTVNTVEGKHFYEAGWRAAVGIAVGAVVGLIYIGVRFGVASALSGLVGSVNSAFFTLGFFAITRIPVFAVGPLLYAAIATIAYIIMWLIHCMKMRDNFKDPEFAKYDTDEAVALSLLTSDKFVYGIAGAFAIVIVLLGLITASTSMMLLVLPALVAVCASLYSAALFAPSVHVPCKRAIDKFKKRHIRTYSGKKKDKAVKTEVEE